MKTEGMSAEYTLRLHINGEKCFGPGVAMLLEGVKKHGSLNSAAKELDMSYSKAWSVIKSSEKALGMKLLTPQTGGINGGGATLTRDAELLMERYSAFVAEARTGIERALERHFG